MEFTNQIKEETWNRQNGLCGLCGVEIIETNGTTERFFHQLLPFESGGKIETDNCVVLCKNCLEQVTSNAKFSDPFSFNANDFSYANLTGDILAAYINSFNSIKNELEELHIQSQSLPDLRNLKNKLIEAREKLKTYTFKKEHIDSFHDFINKSFEELSKRQNEEREKYDKECLENYNRLKSKVDEAIDFTVTSQNFNIAREALIAVQNEFKGIKLKSEQRDELYPRIQKAFEALHLRQMEERESYEMECIENYHNIKFKIDEAIAYCLSTTDFRSAREKLISTQNLFKGLKLKKEQREEQYLRIQQAFDELNKRQDEEKISYESECNSNFEKIKTLIDNAAQFLEESTDYKAVRDNLVETQHEFKGLKLKKDQREEQYSRIQELFNTLNHKQRSDWDTYEIECNENADKLQVMINDAMNEVQSVTEFRNIREKLIDIQNEIKNLKLKKEQRNDFFKKIREAFVVLDNRRLDYRGRRVEEKKLKLQSILSNLENKIKRVEESIDRDKESLEFQQSKFSEVRLGEKEDELKNEIQEKIDNILGRITDKDKSIIDLKTRILDIQNELNTLQ